tara:strand:- start:294 stop:863 length:570 start_codon:yes stop_codon:yes gene_type:complete
MSLDMSEIRTYAERIRNTYYYTIESDQGDPADDLGDFQIIIPPFPYPEHQGSQMGILKITGFHITGQTDAQRVPAVGYDTSGFYVIMSGIGLRGQTFLNTKSSSLRAQRTFFVPNTYGTGSTSKSTTYNRLSGSSDLSQVVMCSNPAGTSIRVEVIDIDTGVKVVENANLQSIIEFSIELVPTQISNGD